jgi:hypothetical protein
VVAPEVSVAVEMEVRGATTEAAHVVSMQMQLLVQLTPVVAVAEQIQKISMVALVVQV